MTVMAAETCHKRHRLQEIVHNRLPLQYFLPQTSFVTWRSAETSPPESSSIAVFVRKIRNKIEDDPSKPRYLQTVWREGYRLGDESMLREEVE